MTKVTVEDYEALIYFVENKINNTKDFYERKELKEKLEQIQKDKEEFVSNEQRDIEKEDSELSKVVQISNDFSESKKEILDKINEYI